MESQYNNNSNTISSPKNNETQLDPTMLSTWSHRAWLASGSTAVLLSLAKLAIGVTNSKDHNFWLVALSSMVACVVGFVVVDLASGVYHWAADNYGCASTPIFGYQAEAFQLHHEFPMRITRHEFVNRTHPFACVVTFLVLPTHLFWDHPIIHGFVGVFFGCVIFTQQFHVWAHGAKNQLPPLVVALQDLHILVGRSQHEAHHRPPYNCNYCVISGFWNAFLDKNKIFKALEKLLFLKFGVKPNSWS
ncbi:hypothetical protein G4B88_003629 [Cannabis sativa]|uniref:Lipid desaturase domain-containing protein n=2 Tax=Cannabis sativa TaxID=3483 RepID=A0A7J6DK34_CANSA|nr:hypothetical protein G4B88_003629 [Cannabis sativa]